MSGLKTLWIDGVGGFAMCDHPSTVLGGGSSDADLRIMGDLPSRAAIFHQRGEDHFLQPLTRCRINGDNTTATCLLNHGDRIVLGTNVELEFHKPTQLSGTAQLRLISRHRWQNSIDGALLLGDSCLLGPSSSAHIRCRQWAFDVVLFRHRDQWLFRGHESKAANPPTRYAPQPLRLGERVVGPDYSMTLL